MGKIRIKDIAQIANVSIGTVDRVIHHRGEVSEATREKIQRLLIQYNYTPDVIASSLALKKQITLGVVMPRLVNEHVFWKLPQEGVQRALNELGQYNLAVESFYFDQYDADDFRRLMEKFPFERIQGVLFAPVFREESVAFIKRCAGEQVPLVLFNSLLEEQSVRSYVGQDAFQSGYVAAKLINYGMEPRRDVAIINMSTRKEHYAHIISREKGFRTFFEERSDRLDLLVTIDLNGVEEQHLSDRLEEAFRQYDIAGLFVTNSRVYKVAEYLAMKGMMNVRLVGYDLLPASIEYLQRDYIDFLISQKPEEQAFKGLHSLFYLVAFNREPKERQLMPIDIITRENLVYYQKQ
ncbi:MAG: LacI family DNA-binding transcriptional regulator [Bacteroidales bacterium]